MAGDRHGQIGDLPFNPDMLEVFLQHPLDQCGQTRNCKDFPVAEKLQKTTLSYFIIHTS
jgi:hypothetical protein